MIKKNKMRNVFIQISKIFFCFFLIIAIFLIYLNDKSISERILDLIHRYKNGFKAYLVLTEKYSGEKNNNTNCHG